MAGRGAILVVVVVLVGLTAAEDGGSEGDGGDGKAVAVPSGEVVSAAVLVVDASELVDEDDDGVSHKREAGLFLPSQRAPVLPLLRPPPPPQGALPLPPGFSPSYGRPPPGFVAAGPPPSAHHHHHHHNHLRPVVGKPVLLPPSVPSPHHHPHRDHRRPYPAKPSYRPRQPDTLPSYTPSNEAAKILI